LGELLETWTSTTPLLNTLKLWNPVFQVTTKNTVSYLDTDPEWQTEQSLKRPSEQKREWMLELNQTLTAEQRSVAGRIGGVICTTMQKDAKTGFFDPRAKVQRKGNLKRWGIKIDGVRIPYSRLSSDFIDYQVSLGTAVEYFNPCNQQPSRPSEDGRFRD